jgi:hypothetical protein
MKICRHSLLEVALIFGDFEMLYYPKSDTTNHKIAGRTTAKIRRKYGQRRGL